MLSVQFFFFLGVVFLLAGTPVPDTPGLTALSAAFFGALSCLGQLLLSRQLFARVCSQEAWFRAERRMFALSFVCFVFWLYGLDLKYWLHGLAPEGRTEGLAELAGLAAFFALLALGWLAGRAPFQKLFCERVGPIAFLVRQSRQNLALVLPWILAALVLDTLRWLIPARFLALLPDPWTEILGLATTLALLVLILPLCILKLWRCQPIPEGPLRHLIADFCASQQFRANLYLWPLQEGQALTAGILGVLPCCRSLLFTPALVQNLGPEELKSVIAHEIGHIRHRHLFWNATLVCAFTLTLTLIAPLSSQAIMDSALLPQFARFLPLAPETLAGACTALPLLALVLLYVRFVFGFFQRNFERQADCHVFAALGGAGPLINAFRTIERLTGGKREKRNWHHFSLDERVAFLQRCEQQPDLPAAQTRKIRHCLLAHFLLLACLCLFVWLFAPESPETLAAKAENQYTASVSRQSATTLASRSEHSGNAARSPRRFVPPCIFLRAKQVPMPVEKSGRGLVLRKQER